MKIAMRKQRRETQLKDAELAVGALERTDPLEWQDLDIAPTMLGLDKAEEGEAPSSDPAGGACIICGQQLSEECVHEDKDWPIRSSWSRCDSARFCVGSRLQRRSSLGDSSAP